MIYPYKKGSASAAALKQGLNTKMILREKSSYQGSPNKTVINWGAKQLPKEVIKSKVINKPEAVAIASDKLLFFQTVDGQVTIPEYTTDLHIARGWVEEGQPLMIRTTLNGMGGEGLHYIAESQSFEELMDQAKLFVKYVPKKDEYRVHVIGGKVVDFQRKAIKNGLPKDSVNFKIRNHMNGFVFVRKGVNPPQKVKDEALKAVELCGLDFGAVDVMWNEHRDKAYVLEVNTAPGLEGQTVQSYIDGLSEMYKGSTNRGKADYFRSMMDAYAKEFNKQEEIGAPDKVLEELSKSYLHYHELYLKALPKKPPLAVHFKDEVVGKIVDLEGGEDIF